ncbi:MAG: HypC/HybG/HupF family hydrogenase formation chaperone [Nitrospirae bacterium]|nr:HypC/HybG/HupF family hydrogenase formation chaperone [Nitrospirota bacterium]
MCVGVPSKIVKIDDYMATIDVEGAQREVSLLLLNEDVKVGDYVIVHAGFAIQKIQEEDAKENLRLMKKIFGIEEVPPFSGKSRKKRKALGS